jgi:hypothetical protein
MLFGLRFLSGSAFIERLGFGLVEPIRQAKALIAERLRLLCMLPLRLLWQMYWKPIEDRLFRSRERFRVPAAASRRIPAELPRPVSQLRGIQAGLFR